MESHLRIFFALVNLVAGSGIFVYLQQLKKKTPDRILSTMQLYVLCFNMIILTYFLMKYLNVNLSGESLETKDIYIVGFSMISSLFLVFMFFSVIKITLLLNVRFRMLRSDPGLRVLLLLPLLIVLLSNLIYYMKIEALKETLLVIHISLMIFLFLFETGLQLIQLRDARRVKERAERKMRLMFSSLFLSRYAVLIGLVNLMIILRPFNRLLMAVLAFIIFFSFNIAPYLWIRFYYAKYLVMQQPEPVPVLELDPLFRRYQISKREQDVFRLLMEGMENREIEEKLYISYNTVKNHVYSIFQKVGVSNRSQFVKLVRSMGENG